jgi:hypothetical protein
MILSFSVFREKIESGEKCQTIRPYNEKRYKMFRNAKKYQLYWHNPRNGGTLIKEVEPKGNPILLQFYKTYSEIRIVLRAHSDSNQSICGIYKDTNELAIQDGFKDKNEMKAWFFKTYGEELFKQKFMILRWSP